MKQKTNKLNKNCDFISVIQYLINAFTSVELLTFIKDKTLFVEEMQDNAPRLCSYLTQH